MKMRAKPHSVDRPFVVWQVLRDNEWVDLEAVDFADAVHEAMQIRVLR